MGTFFGAVFGLLILSAVFVVGAIACVMLLVKAVKRLFSSKD